jgi:hypothetical protein
VPPTPNRRTELQIGVGEVVLERQGWTLQRDAQHMRPQKQAGALKTSRVYSTGGDAWIIRPQVAEISEALKDTVGGYIPASDVELAPGVISYDGFRRRDDLPALGTGASVLSTAAPTFQKRVAAGDDWDAAQLFADAAALPPPPGDATPVVPLDRILSGLVSYLPNTPFSVVMSTAEGWEGKDEFFRFYFGGETETIPAGLSGGHYCLAFRGSGEANLWEYDEQAGDWGEAPRETFRWNPPGASPGGLQNVFTVIPYAMNRIYVTGHYGIPYSSLTFTLINLLTTVAATGVKLQPQNGIATLHHETIARHGHRHLTYATGGGNLRVDCRRDLRLPFSLLQGIYSEPGTLIDGVFEINRSYPAGTPLRVDASWYRYDNTDITVWLYNAADHTPLAVDGDGFFLTVAGQRKYYAVFTLTSLDGHGTPALFSYSVGAPATFVETPLVPVRTSRLQDVRITGPDLEPMQEEAHVRVADEVDEAAVLRNVDGLRTLITVRDRTTDAILSHLFEGELRESTGNRRGVPGTTYPSPDWHDYDAHLSGLWPRLEEQFHDAPPKSFASSADSPHPQASTEFESGFAPWRVTDMIRWYLNSAGVRDDELDIPNLPIRYFAGEGGGGDALTVQPGVCYGTAAASLVKDVLGAILLRDPNAGTRGLWRVVIPPLSTSLNILWRFWLDPPPNPGRAVDFPQAYGTADSLILHDTWQPRPERPRGNVVSVFGVDGDGHLLAALLENATSIAYLGRRAPVKRGIDPALNTLEACMWVARRINEVACTPRDWVDFTAPLVLVTDPQDPLQVLPRPLRINDLIYVRFGGVDHRYLLRSVNPGWDRSDDLQFAHYEALHYPL